MCSPLPPHIRCIITKSSTSSYRPPMLSNPSKTCLSWLNRTVIGSQSVFTRMSMDMSEPKHSRYPPSTSSLFPAPMSLTQQRAPRPRCHEYTQLSDSCHIYNVWLSTSQLASLLLTPPRSVYGPFSFIFNSMLRHREGQQCAVLCMHVSLPNAVPCNLESNAMHGRNLLTANKTPSRHPPSSLEMRKEAA